MYTFWVWFYPVKMSKNYTPKFGGFLDFRDFQDKCCPPDPQIPAHDLRVLGPCHPAHQLPGKRALVDNILWDGHATHKGVVDVCGMLGHMLGGVVMIMVYKGLTLLIWTRSL